MPPRAGLPRDLWRVEAKIEGVVDLRGIEPLEAVGLSAPRPNRTDWPAYQAVGEGLHAEGAAAIAAPSAARDGGLILCVFWPPAEGVELRWSKEATVGDAPPVPRGLRT